MSGPVPERFRSTSAPRIHSQPTMATSCASIRDGLRCQLMPAHPGSHLAQTIHLWDDQWKSATTTNQESR